MGTFRGKPFVTPPVWGENRLVGKVKQQNRTASAQYVFQQTIFKLSYIRIQQFYPKWDIWDQVSLFALIKHLGSTLRTPPPRTQSGSAPEIGSWPGPLSRRAHGPKLSFVCREPKGSLAGRQVGCQPIGVRAGCLHGIERATRGLVVDRSRP